MFWGKKEYHHYHENSRDVEVKHGKKETVVNKHVHEHKAPTDDSIRYADEMRKKVRDSIIAAVTTDNNALSIKAFHFSDLAAFENIIIVNYTLNGHERRVEYRYNQDLFIRDTQATNKIIFGLKEAIAKDISKAVLSRAWTDVMPDFIKARETQFKNVSNSST